MGIFVKRWGNSMQEKYLLCATEKQKNTRTNSIELEQAEKVVRPPDTVDPRNKKRVGQPEGVDQQGLRMTAQKKEEKANGGCLGVKSRRRTWHTAKSVGELYAGEEPTISEWGNPARKSLVTLC